MRRTSSFRPGIGEGRPSFGSPCIRDVPLKTDTSTPLIGLGTSIPTTVVTQDDSTAFAHALCAHTEHQREWVIPLHAGTGIDTRYMVLPEQLIRDFREQTALSGSCFLPDGSADDRGPTTGERMAIYAEEAGKLALLSVRRAIESAKIDPATITHLVTVSCTGFFSPGVDFQLIRELGLATTIERVHVGFMGCHGSINGLRTARALARSSPDAVVLMCATELCSLHYHYGWSPGRVIANALFADGSAAAILTHPSRAPSAGLRVVDTASCLIPDSAAEMSWIVGDNGFEMVLTRRVPGLIAEHLRPWADAWLARHDLTTETVAGWVIHPGGPKILEAAATTLGITAEQLAPSRAILADYGNMSSPTVMFILDRVRQSGIVGPVVMLAFGPGLIAEGALLQMR